MSLRRHVLRLVVLATAVAVCFSAFAGSASAKKYSAKQKAQIRKSLKKQVKKNPGIVKRKSFLRRAALVNFVLPVTIRLRNKCADVSAQNVGSCGPSSSQAAGTGLNQTSDPTATVDLGPSLGSRTIPLSGSLSAEIQFNDSYDGGALGNVKLRIYSGTGSSTHQLKTSSVPLLWNPDITGNNSGQPLSTRSDAEFAKATFRAGNVLASGGFPTSLSTFAKDANQGCGDWTSTGQAAAQSQSLAGGLPFGGTTGYNSLFYGSNFNLVAWGALAPTIALEAPANQAAATAALITALSTNTAGNISGWLTAYPAAAAGVVPAPFPSNAAAEAVLGPNYGKGAPGYTVYNGPSASYSLPVLPGVDNPDNITTGGTTGNNEVVGTSSTPFPSAAPSYALPTSTGGLTAQDTVLRTNALTLGIATPGTYVDLTNGTGINGNVTGTGLPTGEGSSSIITGLSGGEANLFGNIPGKKYGIDVTVNLATQINSIFRIMDQDVFDAPSLTEGGRYPAGIFNCRQIWSGAVQNYIPGVRLTGNLRIAPAITKDGKLRIARAQVSTDANNPPHVALSACLQPLTTYNKYAAPYDTPSTNGMFSGDTTPFTIPTFATVNTGNPANFNAQLKLAGNGNPALPFLNDRRYAPASGQAPGVGCNSDPATIVRDSSMSDTTVQKITNGAVSSDGYTTSAKGDKATVAGDIKVNNLDVDVLIGDQ